MSKVLRSDRRDLCWLGWFETAGAALYAWSGMQDLSWDGQTWKGVGHLLSLATVDKGDAMSFRTQEFTLNGLDPQVLAGMDESVRGRGAKLWMAARNGAGQVIRDPLLVGEFEQDTLRREIAEDGTITLTLSCFAALPRFDKPTGRKWSQESQTARYAGDEGMYYTQKLGRTGQQINWRPAV